jgi:hypothetical protein
MMAQIAAHGQHLSNRLRKIVVRIGRTCDGGDPKIGCMCLTEGIIMRKSITSERPADGRELPDSTVGASTGYSL